MKGTDVDPGDRAGCVGDHPKRIRSREWIAEGFWLATSVVAYCCVGLLAWRGRGATAVFGEAIPAWRAVLASVCLGAGIGLACRFAPRFRGGLAIVLGTASVLLHLYYLNTGVFLTFDFLLEFAGGGVPVPGMLWLSHADMGLSSILCVVATIHVLTLLGGVGGAVIDDRRLRVASFTVGSLLFAFGLFDSRNPLGRFAGSTVARLVHRAALVHGDEYPLVRPPSEPLSAPPRSPPDLLLVQVESLGAHVVGLTVNGSSLTPNLDALARRSVVFERCFASATHTIRGQEAILLSLYPDPRGFVSLIHRECRFHGLASILSEQGYRSLFIQSSPSLDFQNTGVLLSKAGFEKIETVPQAELARIGSWGVGDRELYVHACRRFRELKAEHNGPVFLMLATVESHFPFGDVPREHRVFPGEGLGEWERYCNSIHHADASLRVLLESFRRELDSGEMLLALTADHSYPVRSGAAGRPETACDEIAFRIPWILHGGGIKPEVRRELVSQVDIGPTLLDCLSVSATNHFMGRSVLRERPDAVAAVAFQPGDGGIQVCTIGSTVFLRQVSSGGVRWLRVDEDGAWRPQDVSEVPTRDRRRIEEALLRWDGCSHALATDRVWPNGSTSVLR